MGAAICCAETETNTQFTIFTLFLRSNILSFQATNMNNELQAARFVHSALIVGCVALIALALASATAQHYVSARHWLAELSAIDLEKWAGRIENRQSIMLSGPLWV